MDTTRTTRRGALVGAASGAILAAWPSVGRAVTGPVTLAEFMELSEALTDHEFDLQNGVGAQYQAAIDPVALQKLVDATVRKFHPTTFNQILASGALNDQQNAETAQQILTYWYSGLVSNKTADYVGALAWAAIDDFAQPSSTKLGFPKWEDKPS